MVSYRVGCFFALLALCGCSHQLASQLGHFPEDSPTAAMGLSNPLFVPAADHEFVWNQTVDAIDDYFRIEREERVRLVGGVITEGRIETAPTTGATVFEPWHRDSTPGFERWEATLQSIRRRASVRVMPVARGHSIEVVVFKEIEDLDRPEHSTIGASTLRHDGSIVRTEVGNQAAPVTLGWISLGRDVSLEQRILADLQARLTAAPSLPGHLSGLH